MRTVHLIVGGTGTLGGALTRRLLAQGRRVRVMTRRPDKATPLAVAGAEVVSGDLVERDSLARACHQADIVVAAAHSLFGRGRLASVRVDGRGHRDLIDAAKRAGVRRLLYTSAYDCGPSLRAVPFFRLKYEVEDYLKSSGLDYTILRPTAFMEAHAHALIGEPLRRTGRVVLMGRGERPRNFVAADDVARVALLALSESSMIGQTLDVGGPDNRSNMDVVRLYEQALGRTARVTHVPLGIVRVLAKLTRPLHPGLSQVMQTAVVAETVDQTCHACPLRDRFGIEPTGLADFVARQVQGVPGVRS